MAKWGMIGGRGRSRWSQNVVQYASLRIENGELLSGVYLTCHPIATEVEDAVHGFIEGVRIINVPNDKKFCAAVREQYAAALAALAAGETVPVECEVQP